MDSCIIQPQKENGIIEPGCFIKVLPSFINSGGCPTPSHQVSLLNETKEILINNVFNSQFIVFDMKLLGQRQVKIN